MLSSNTKKKLIKIKVSQYQVKMFYIPNQNPNCIKSRLKGKQYYQ